MSGNATLQAYIAAVERLEDRIEILEAALYRIKQWADAYPLEVFPEVDSVYLLRAHEVLTQAGMGLDRINASTMRHVIEGAGKIARDVLTDDEGKSGPPSKGDKP